MSIKSTKNVNKIYLKNQKTFKAVNQLIAKILLNILSIYIHFKIAMLTLTFGFTVQT